MRELGQARGGILQFTENGYTCIVLKQKGEVLCKVPEVVKGKREGGRGKGKLIHPFAFLVSPNSVHRIGVIAYSFFEGFVKFCNKVRAYA